MATPAPALTLPQQSFLAKYTDSSTDRYQADYSALNTIAGTQGSAATYMKSLVDVPIESAPILLGLSIENERTVARAIVCPTRFQGNTDWPSCHDNQVYAMLTEPCFGTFGTFTELQESDFDLTERVVVPATIDRARDLLANKELLELLPSDARDSQTVRVRVLQPLPEFLFPLVWQRDLTPKQLFFELLNALEAVEQVDDCSELVNWLLVAVMRGTDNKSMAARTLFRPVALNPKLGAFLQAVLRRSLPSLFNSTSAPKVQPVHCETYPVRARYYREVQAMICAIRRGQTEIEMDAQFLGALAQLYQTTVADEFFDVLTGNMEIDFVMVDASMFDNNAVTLELTIFERIGRALGTNYRLANVRICISDGVIGIIMATAMLISLKQIKHLEWDVSHSPFIQPTDTDTTCRMCSIALNGNLSIESMSVKYDSRTDLVSGICRAFFGLNNLTRLELSNRYSTDYPFNVEEAEALAEIFPFKSIQNLKLVDVSFSEDAAAQIFIQAFSQSALTNLSLNSRDGPLALSMMSALIGGTLNELELINTTFEEFGLSMALCSVLSSLEIAVVKLRRIKVHTEAETELGMALCRPSLWRLNVEESTGAIYDSISSNLKNAPNLRILRLNQIINPMENEAIVVNILNGCRHCTNLSELSIMWLAPWSILMDQAAATMMMYCRRLRQVEIGASNNGATVCVYSSPSFLAACRMHGAIEDIHLQRGWCPLFLAALDRITARNAESRKHRKHFETLAADRKGRVAFGRSLIKVKDKPHLLFLALTSNKHHLA